MKSERLARFLIIGVIAAVALIPLVYQLWGKRGVVEVRAIMPEKGGWLPNSLYARLGEPLRLRLTSEDVVHSFALGRSDLEPIDILPGQPVEVSLVFDQPGNYTFYCTRWCGEDHWRMRGTITVVGDGPPKILVQETPLYQQLGIDLDAPQQSVNLNWSEIPSAEQGKSLGVSIPADFLTQDHYRAHSPQQTWEALDAGAGFQGLSDLQRWDLVAWIWQIQTSPEKLALGEALYQRDCAACHGVDGQGNGVFGHPPEDVIMKDAGNLAGHSVEWPTNFREAGYMMVSSPARLQGKIIRGGMGTGMPSWGLIYTEEQTWALVDYLWVFVFDYSD